jgi:MFS family permease
MSLVQSMRDQTSADVDVAGRGALLMTSTGYGIYLLLGWTSVLIPALIISIEDGFGRGDADIGAVYFVGALLNGAGALGGGFIAERLGHRHVLVIALGALTVGLFVQGTADRWLLFIGAVAIGQIGSGAANGGVQAVFMEIFPERRGSALNLLHLFFGAGALLGPVTAGFATTAGISWRALFLGSAFAGLALVAAVRSLPGPQYSTRLDDPLVSVPTDRPDRLVAPFIWLAVSIACYEAASMGVASWLVRYLSDDSVRAATTALALFWGGICGIRLAAPVLAPRWSPVSFAAWCIIGSSVTLALAVITPLLPVAIVLFGLTGVFVGPIYPMIIAIGGDMYPDRLPALSGGLTTAATAGAIVYPPIMGIVADGVGIRLGLLGAALLGIPALVALLQANRCRTVNIGEPRNRDNM